MATVCRSDAAPVDPLMLVFTGHGKVTEPAVHNNLSDLLRLEVADDGLPTGEWPREPYPVIVVAHGVIPESVIRVVDWLWAWAGIPYTLVIDEATAELPDGQSLIREAKTVHQVTDCDGALVETLGIMHQWTHEIRIIALGTPTGVTNRLSRELVDHALAWGCPVLNLAEGLHPIMLLEPPPEPDAAVLTETAPKPAARAPVHQGQQLLFDTDLVDHEGPVRVVQPLPLNLVVFGDSLTEPLHIDPDSPTTQAFIRWFAGLDQEETDALIRILANIIQGAA